MAVPASNVSAPTGARPRFVWSSTPVALTTGCSIRRSIRPTRACASAMLSLISTVSPRLARARAASAASRAHAVSSGGARPSSSASPRSIEGSARRGSIGVSVGPAESRPVAGRLWSCVARSCLLPRDAAESAASMVTLREAATVMLVRDDPDLHVFMLRRNLQADWVGGAYVFPGGAVDADDRGEVLAQRCPTHTDAAASALLGLSGGGLGFWVAAVRETFEEAGVLLARSEITNALVDPSGPKLASARDELNAGTLTFGSFVLDQGLVLDDGALHVFSHWITPVGMPRRYDTWFFVAEAPEGHAYAHDDGETVASIWIRPLDALDAADR